MFTPDGDWQAPKEFPNLSGVKVLGLDCETRDENLRRNGPGGVRKDGYMTGFSLATEDGSKWYFPFRHLGGGNLDRDACLRFAKDVLETPDVLKVGVNLLYDMEWFRAEGITIKGPLYDCSTAETLIDEEAFSTGLDAMLYRYFREHKNESLLEEAGEAYGFHRIGESKAELKRNMWRLPARYVGPYAESDAYDPLRLRKAQMKIIKEEGLERVLDLEMRILPILLEMRFKGVPVDLEKAARVSLDWGIREDQLRHDLKKETGFKFDAGFEWSAVQLGALCDKLKIPYLRSQKNNAPLINKHFFGAHEEHPVLSKVLNLRTLTRLKGTFVDELIFSNEINGRIHCQFRPVRSVDDDTDGEDGTRSGRFSSKNPNLQQVPARDPELSPKIRGLFVPDAGKKWGKFDYSQQEPRIAVHYAHTLGLPKADQARDAYINDPKTDFYNMLADLTKLVRSRCKTVYLGRSYGMGKAKLAYDLGTSENEATQILNEFDELAPFIKGLSDATKRAADTRGFIKTFLGRRSRFNLWEPRNAWQLRQEGVDTTPVSSIEEAKNRWPNERYSRAYTYKAMNRLIQGSAADMGKQGLLNVYEETGQIPYLLVHDEMDFGLDNYDEGLEIQRILENVFDMSVPMRCDYDFIDHWK